MLTEHIRPRSHREVIPWIDQPREIREKSCAREREWGWIEMANVPR
jgi:hypothetical protein